MKTYLDAALDGKNDWWRYLIGYPFILITWLLLGAIPVIALSVFVTFDGDPQTILAVTGFVGINPLLNFAVNMFTFIPFILATSVAVIWIHRRHLRTLITPAAQIEWKRLFFSAAVWAVLAGIAALTEALLHPGRYAFTPDLKTLVPFAVLAVIMLPLQTSAEEFFFRGYILQNIGLKIKNIWILSVISGILFTLPHLPNPEVSANPILVPLFYFFFGAFAALITLRDNGLELALGMHMGNNLFTAIFANYSITALASPSLFLIQEFDVIYNLIAPVVQMIAFYFLFFKLWPKKIIADPALLES
jgi:membrane protease YdiL (CAAX protease family)